MSTFKFDVRCVWDTRAVVCNVAWEVSRDCNQIYMICNTRCQLKPVVLPQRILLRDLSTLPNTIVRGTLLSLSSRSTFFVFVGSLDVWNTQRGEYRILLPWGPSGAPWGPIEAQ